MTVVSHDDLDVSACLNSGQVFRFVMRDGAWAGVDAGNVIRAKGTPRGWEVSSSPDTSAWRSFFRMDDDWDHIRSELVARESRLAPLVAANPGLRIIAQGRADETLFSFLCTPNNHLSRIGGMVQWLGRLGTHLGDGLYDFPEPLQIAELREEQLRAAGFGYRARTIIGAANEVVNRGGLGYLDSLKNAGYEAAWRELTTLPGVGRKIADCVCLFGLHYVEAVPLDVHLWRSVCEMYFPAWQNSSLTPSRYEEAVSFFRNRFETYSGYCQQYLFFSRIRNKT